MCDESRSLCGDVVTGGAAVTLVVVVGEEGEGEVVEEEVAVVTWDKCETAALDCGNDCVSL